MTSFHSIYLWVLVIVHTTASNASLTNGGGDLNVLMISNSFFYIELTDFYAFSSAGRASPNS